MTLFIHFISAAASDAETQFTALESARQLPIGPRWYVP